MNIEIKRKDLNRLVLDNSNSLILLIVNIA